ncbi:InlB B-repeat-containing protein [Adlercreutzia murintestinalis]|uniref:InlB B-repeat-containing protein n=1 Tax=Adlercreutzia murintestinalis TaxID=2941325 RepID=UPI0020408D4A|nr:hypothetical protein [Adlercreutzia murintestinalis]
MRIAFGLRRMLSAFMAVIMVVSLCPATALTAWAATTADEAQDAMDAWQPTEDEQGGQLNAEGTTDANTVVTVSTYSSFRATDSRGPQGTITVEASKQADTDSGRLWAKFEGGSPYPTGATVDGQIVSGSHYVMELTWTKNGRTNSAYRITRPLPATGHTYEVDCSLNSIFGDEPREGKYVFSMTLIGNGDQRAQGVTFAEFPISDSQFTRDQIDNTASPEQPQAVVDGAFAASAILSVTDITAGNGSAAAGTLGMLENAAAGQQIAEAWQMEIVNGSMLPDPTLFDAATNVNMQITDATRDQLLGTDSFTIVSLVGGKPYSVTFTKDPGQTASPYTYTSQTTGSDGAPLTATLTVPDSGRATLDFATDGLGGTLGAFAVAVPAAGSYTVEARAVNGTISPTGTLVRPVGTDATFQLSPLGGFVLDGAKVTINGTTASFSAYTLNGNTLTLKSRPANTTTQLVVEFAPFVPSGQPSKLDMSITGVCANPASAFDDPVANSIIEATYQQVGADGVASQQTAQAAEPALTNVQVGSPVLINFKKVADGYVVRGVRMGATQSALNNAPLMTVTGTTFTIPAMTTDAQLVQVEYEPGIQPPTLDIRHQVIGLAGAGGTVGGSSDMGVTHGNYFVSAVRADGDHVIESVKVYAGALSEAPANSVAALADLTAQAAGKKSYDVNLTSVTSDLTVVATFERGPVSVDVAQVAGGRVWLASAGETAQPPYEVAHDTPVNFRFTVQDEYRFDGVWVGNTKKSLTDLGVDASASQGSFALSFAASTTITPVFVPEQMPDPARYVYATVVTDGNGTVNPEGGVTFARGSALTLNFGTVAGKETWRASKVTVSSDGLLRSVELNDAQAASYIFDPTASPWNQLGEPSMYTIAVEFADASEGGQQPDPAPLPDPVQIAIATTDGGMVSPAGTLVDGQRVYQAAPGVQQAFTLIPDTGYTLDKVWLNVGDGGRMVDVTNMSAPDGTRYVSDGVLCLTPAADTDYKVLVEFGPTAESPKVRWNVQTEVANGRGGSITPAGTTQTQDGQVVEFSFMNDAGQRLASVSVQTAQADSFDGVTAQDLTSMVVDKRLKLTINANTRVVATFEMDPDFDPSHETARYTLDVQAEGSGTVSPAGAQELFVDSALTISFKPDRGAALVSVEATCADPQWSVPIPVLSMNEDAGTYSYAFGLPADSASRFAGKTVTLKATFERAAVSHAVTVVTEGPTGVSASAGPHDASGYGYVSPGYDCGSVVNVAQGASQMFYFVERPGYVVSDVYVGSTRVAGSVQSYLLAGVTSDMTLRVVYAAQTNAPGTNEDEMFTVNASVSGGGGAISPAGDARVPKGGSVMYALIPDDGYQLASLTVDGIDQMDQVDGDSYLLAPVSAAHVVRATFKRQTEGGGNEGEERPTPGDAVLHHVYVSVSGNGMVTPGNVRAGDVGDIEVVDGGQQTFSFLPDLDAPEGKVNVLDYIEIRRGALVHRIDTAMGSYTFFSVRADVSLSVCFKQVDKGGPDGNKPTYARYTVNASASAGGTVVPAGDTVVNAGASLTLRAVPDEGFHLSYLAIDANATGAGAGGTTTTYIPASALALGCYTLGNIQADHSVRAVFVQDGSAGEEGFTTYTIDVDGARVQASLSGVVHVKEGADQTLTLAPTFGNQIAAVRVVSAADPSQVLWQTSLGTDAGRLPVDVPLRYFDDVDAAVVLVEFGPGYSQTDPSAVYTVTTTVLPDASGNMLGTVTPGGTQQFPAGSDVIFTMVPFKGCTVDAVTANGDPVVFTQEGGYYQFTAHDLSGALNVAVRFRLVAEGEGNIPEPGRTVQVTYDVQGAGSIQPASPALVRPGDDLTITLVPRAGATLGTLIVGGRTVTADAVQLANGSYLYTIKGVQADTVVAATFVNADGTVSDPDNGINVNVKVDVKVSGNIYGGTVDPNHALSLSPGASQLFLIKPADGFYVADVVLEYADGRTERPAVNPWLPDYSTGQMRPAQVGSGSSVQQAGSSQTNQVSSIDGVPTVQKPYSYVEVGNIRESFTMRVTLDDCMNDPANTRKEYYLYTDAAAGLVTSTPTVGGNGTVVPGDGTNVVAPNGEKTFIITPGTRADGTQEELESVTIHGMTVDLSGSDVRTNGVQDPAKVAQKMKESGALRPGESFVWVDAPAPGHYELTLKAEQREDGTWFIDQPIVIFTGQGGAFTNRVLVRAVEIDESGQRVPVDASVLKMTATRLADGKTTVDGQLDLAYGGALQVKAELLNAQYELVSISPDDTGYVTVTPRDRAEEVAADAPNTFYAYGPGSVLATVQKKSQAQAHYFVEATAGKGGAISAAKENYQVGETAQFTFTPDAGYQVASVTLNGQKSDYTSRTYTVPSEVCVKDAKVTLHVEFKATLPAAGDPQGSAGSRLLRTLTSLATTGDNGMPMATGLLAVACGALGVAVLVWSRSRGRRKDAAAAHAAIDD